MPRLYKADVDDHINFVRTVLHRVLCLEHLHRGGHVAVGKSDYGADSQLIPHKILCLLHITGRNAHRGGGVFQAFPAQLFYLLPGSCLL